MLLLQLSYIHYYAIRCTCAISFLFRSFVIIAGNILTAFFSLLLEIPLHTSFGRNENSEMENDFLIRMLAARKIVYRALGQMALLPRFHTGFSRINFYFAKKITPRRHFIFTCGALAIAYSRWKCIYVLYILLSYSKCSEAFHLGRRYT